jgi:hypothetical protein
MLLREFSPNGILFMNVAMLLRDSGPDGLIFMSLVLLEAAVAQSV